MPNPSISHWPRLGGIEFPNCYRALEKLSLSRGTCYIADPAMSFNADSKVPSSKQTHPATYLLVSFASSVPEGIVALEF